MTVCIQANTHAVGVHAVGVRDTLGWTWYGASIRERTGRGAYLMVYQNR